MVGRHILASIQAGTGVPRPTSFLGLQAASASQKPDSGWRQRAPVCRSSPFTSRDSGCQCRCKKGILFQFL